MESENFEDWVSTGMPRLNRDPNANYTVELTEEGKVVWRQVAEPNLSEASAFQIQGTFTSWDMYSFHRSEDDYGLWTFELTLGSSGQEAFQIAVEYDPYLVLYPEEKLCTRRTAKVLGPSQAPTQDHAWLIKGSPGTRYRVELFVSGATAAVFWQPAAAMLEQLMQSGVVEVDEIQE